MTRTPVRERVGARVTELRFPNLPVGTVARRFAAPMEVKFGFLEGRHTRRQNKLTYCFLSIY